MDAPRRRLGRGVSAAEFDSMLGQHLQQVGMVMPKGLSQDTARD